MEQIKINRLREMPQLNDIVKVYVTDNSAKFGMVIARNKMVRKEIHGEVYRIKSVQLIEIQEPNQEDISFFFDAKKVEFV